MIKLISTSPCRAALAVLLGLYVQQGVPAETGEAQLIIQYRDNLLHVYADRVPVRDVAKVLADETGATVSLVGSDSLADQCISARVEDKPLEKAVAEIFRDFSTAVYPMPGSSMPKISIFLTNLDAPPAHALAADASEPPQPSPDTIPAARDVPRDLDDYMPLREPTHEPTVDATSADAIDPEAQAEMDAAQELHDEQRVERAISATASPFSHIRRMAVNELAGSRHPRATGVLADIAVSENAPAEERSDAAEALWRHAGDFEFRDTEANEALRILAEDADSSVSAIAKDALRDMERYLQRSR